jgi:hypothetical protein
LCYDNPKSGKLSVFEEFQVIQPAQAKPELSLENRFGKSIDPRIIIEDLHGLDLDTVKKVI